MILVTNDFYRVSAQQCMHNRLSILIKQLHPSVCPSAMFHGIVFKTAKLTHRHTSAYASQPSDNGGGVVFLRFWTFFRVWKWSSQWLYWGNLYF